MILFHGTSAVYKDRILREGLLPRSRTGISNWSKQCGGRIESKPHLVYLTLSYPVYFALQAGEEADDLLILKVRVKGSELYPDEDFLAYIVKMQKKIDVPLEEINPLVEPLKNKHMASMSLKHNGIAAVKKVTPRRIIDHRTIQFDDWQTIMALGGDSMPTPMNFRVLGTRYNMAVEALFEEGELAAVEVMR